MTKHYVTTALRSHTTQKQLLHAAERVVQALALGNADLTTVQLTTEPLAQGGMPGDFVLRGTAQPKEKSNDEIRIKAEGLREAADDMDAEYEARTAKVGSYGQMKIRAALRMGAGMNRKMADRLEGK